MPSSRSGNLVLSRGVSPNGGILVWRIGPFGEVEPPAPPTLVQAVNVRDRKWGMTGLADELDRLGLKDPTGGFALAREAQEDVKKGQPKAGIGPETRLEIPTASPCTTPRAWATRSGCGRGRHEAG